MVITHYLLETPFIYLILPAWSQIRRAAPTPYDTRLKADTNQEI